MNTTLKLTALRACLLHLDAHPGTGTNSFTTPGKALVLLTVDSIINILHK